MSLGMFSVIPLPRKIWDEKLTFHMLSTFPFVGLIIGAIWWLVALLMTALSVPIMLTVAVLSLAPFLIAGFVHLDGYMDTSDAVLSWRSTEDKLRILLDSRVGAFAVIMLAILFVMQFSAMYVVVENGNFFALLIVISVLSRCSAAFSFFSLRHNSKSDFIFMLKQQRSTLYKVFVVIISVLAIIASFLYAGFFGLAVSAVVVLGYLIAIWCASKSLGGISGDLLGYALVISEIFGLVAFAVLYGVLGELGVFYGFDFWWCLSG